MSYDENNPPYGDNIPTEAIVPEEELQESSSGEIFTMQLNDFPVEIKSGLSSVIGSRAVQQDAARVDNEYMFFDRGVYLAVMCDGMGGMTGGEVASNLCVTKMFEAFYCVDVRGRVPSFFKFMIENIDKMIYNLTDDNGKTMHSGSTLTSIIIEDGSLYWASVGDSHIYIKRGNEMMCVNKDHNYGMVLDRKVKDGQMKKEEAQAAPNRAALVSYIGIGGVPYMDINPHPFPLRSGDTVLLCSDGLYHSVSEREIIGIIDASTDMQQAAEALTAAAIAKGKRHQDNTTAVLVQYCEKVMNSAPFNMPMK